MLSAYPPHAARRLGRLPRARLLAAGLAACLLADAGAGAVRDKAGWAEADAAFRYTVQPGDTLPLIAARYLQTAGDAKDVARRNGLPPAAPLRPGQVLLVPERLLRGEPLNALVTAFRGQVLLNGAPVTKIGAMLREGGRVQTGAGASVSLSLADGSSITLPSQSVVEVQRLRRVLLTGHTERVFMLRAGRSEMEVTPRYDDRDRFEMRTPVSVTAVRGTQFRVAVLDSGGAAAATAGVVRGTVSVTAAGSASDLPTGFGIRSEPQTAGAPVPLLPPPDFAPVVIQPDGQQVFALSPVAQATLYHVQVANDETFRDVLADTISPETTIILPALDTGSYWVRGTVLDAQGIEGLPKAHLYSYTRPPGADGARATDGGTVARRQTS